MYKDLLAQGRLQEKHLEPKLDELKYYILAFFEIGSCRTDNGPIPFTAVVQYAQIYNQYDFDDFLYIIRVLDERYLSNLKTKMEKQANANNTN